MESLTEKDVSGDEKSCVRRPVRFGARRLEEPLRPLRLQLSRNPPSCVAVDRGNGVRFFWSMRLRAKSSHRGIRDCRRLRSSSAEEIQN